jgi:hypothetical protein
VDLSTTNCVTKLTIEAGSKARISLHLDSPARAVAEAYRLLPFVNDVIAQFPRMD